MSGLFERWLDQHGYWLLPILIVLTAAFAIVMVNA